MLNTLANFLGLQRRPLFGGRSEAPPWARAPTVYGAAPRPASAAQPQPPSHHPMGLWLASGFDIPQSSGGNRQVLSDRYPAHEKVPILAEDLMRHATPFEPSSYQSATVDDNLVGSGTLLNTYTGEVYQLLQEACPPPTTSRGGGPDLSRESEQRQRRLENAMGGVNRKGDRIKMESRHPDPEPDAGPATEQSRWLQSRDVLMERQERQAKINFGTYNDEHPSGGAEQTRKPLPPLVVYPYMPGTSGLDEEQGLPLPMDGQAWGQRASPSQVRLHEDQKTSKRTGIVTYGSGTEARRTEVFGEKGRDASMSIPQGIGTLGGAGAPSSWSLEGISEDLPMAPIVPPVAPPTSSEGRLMGSQNQVKTHQSLQAPALQNASLPAQAVPQQAWVAARQRREVALERLLEFETMGPVSQNQLQSQTRVSGEAAPILDRFHANSAPHFTERAEMPVIGHVAESRPLLQKDLGKSAQRAQQHQSSTQKVIAPQTASPVTTYGAAVARPSLGQVSAEFSPESRAQAQEVLGAPMPRPGEHRYSDEILRKPTTTLDADSAPRLLGSEGQTSAEILQRGEARQAQFPNQSAPISGVAVMPQNRSISTHASGPETGAPAPNLRGIGQELRPATAPGGTLGHLGSSEGALFQSTGAQDGARARDRLMGAARSAQSFQQNPGPLATQQAALKAESAVLEAAQNTAACEAAPAVLGAAEARPDESLPSAPQFWQGHSAEAKTRGGFSELSEISDFAPGRASAASASSLSLPRAGAQHLLSSDIFSERTAPADPVTSAPPDRAGNVTMSDRIRGHVEERAPLSTCVGEEVQPHKQRLSTARDMRNLRGESEANRSFLREADIQPARSSASSVIVARRGRSPPRRLLMALGVQERGGAIGRFLSEPLASRSVEP
jgi:hypothetical protein